MSGRSGFTLAELLVAVAVLVLLTLGLYGALSGAMSIWRMGESRRQTDEEARTILAELSADLESIHPARPQGAPLPGCFVRGSPAGDLLVRFVRTLGGRDVTPRIRSAGEGTPAEGWSAHRLSGRGAGPDDLLLAQGGLVEVFWFYSSATETLLRGERAPVGGAGSFFDWNTVSNVAFLQQVGRTVSRHVLAIEALFWGPDTTSWDPLLQPAVGGPLKEWDSTCQVDPAFPYQGDPRGASLGGAFLPEKVRLNVVVGSPDGGERTANLARPLAAADGVLEVNRPQGFPDAEDNPFPFLKVEGEWIRYTAKSGNRFTLAQRGARGTTAVDHPVSVATPAGALVPVQVRSGRLHTLTVDVPVARSGWR